MRKSSILLVTATILLTFSACTYQIPNPPAQQNNTENSQSSNQKKEWPDNENTKGVPRPNFDTIISTFDSGGITNITYNNVSESDAKQYLETIKSAGFVNNVSESSSSFNTFYGAKNSNGQHISFNYSSGTLSISFDRI